MMPTTTNQHPAQTAAEELTMQAILQDRYGEAAEVLRLDTIARPEAGEGEVLVRVHAAGLDRGVWHLMTGLAYPVRLAGYGVRKPNNPVRGRELAGVVAAVGAGVTEFHVGDEVFGIGEGTFAEYARARVDRLAAKPPSLTFQQAAASTISAITALQAVRDAGGVKADQHVLVIGASGGVGTFAVQMAKALGAHVTGVASTAKLDLVRSIGADAVVDYMSEDFADGTRRYDVILDIGGNRSLRHLRRALTPGGTLVLVGGEAGGRWTGGMGRVLRAMLLSRFVGQRLRGFLNSENAADLRAVAGLADSGQVTPVIDCTYALADTVAAIQYMEAGRARGKVVITV